MKGIAVKCLGVLLLSFWLSCTSYGQNITGTIVGTVFDSKGGAVANATVTVTNTDRNEVIRSVNTDASGGYVALLLPIGRYTVSVEMAGFKKAKVTDISLNVNDKLTVNLTIEVGSVTESVTVEATVAQVELQSATPAGLITGTQIRELALGTRNYEQLVSLMPGVSMGTLNQLYVGNSLPSGLAAVVSFGVNGQRNSANNWTIDGVDNVDRGSNLTLSNFPSVDALAEFKVLRSLYDAEFGRAGGGQINVVTKSGTNSFHGDVYEFFRSDVLNANNFFNNRNRLVRPPLRYNNFGYTVGGPVLKNKSFFFFSEEFRRVINYPTFSATSPTAALLGTSGGNAATFTNQVCVAVSNGQCTAVGNSIPTANFNSAAAAYIKDIWSKMPAPNPNTLIQSNNLVTTQRSVFNFREELVRIDHTFTPKFSVFGRYSHDSIPTQEPGGLFTGAVLPGVANTTTNSPGWQATGHFNYTISPRWLNDGGYAFNYSAIVSDPLGLDTKANSPDVVSAVTLPFSVSLSRIPDLSISGFSGISSFGQYRDYNRDHNAFDNMTWLKGRHSFRFGISYHHYNKNENAGGANTGQFSVVNSLPTMAAGVTPPTACTTSTAQCNQEKAWSNFLNGFTNFTQLGKDLTADIIMQQWEAYAQDEFRVRPGLTVSLGLRYSFFGAPTDGFGNLNNFDPALWDPAKAPTVSHNGGPSAGLLCLVGTPASTFCPGGGTPNPNADLLNGFIVGGKNSPFGSHISNQDSKNFGPRIGIAWDPFGDGKTSVRTGYGLFYDAVAVGNYENTVYNNPPIVNSVNINATQLQNPAAGASLVAIPKGNTLFVMPVPFSTPYTQQWSLSVQRQLWKHTLIDVGYFGNNSHHLSGLLDINQPVPGAAAAAGLTCGNTFGTPCTGAQNTIVTNSTQGQSLNAVRPFQGYGPMRALETEFNSNYHALQASIQKHWGANVLQLNYTWSHNLTDNPSDRSNAPQNPYDLHAEYGPSALDRRHNLTASYVYDLPWYKTQEGVRGHALGGWEVSGLWYFYTGTPLTVTEGTQDPGGIGCLISSPVSCRPDITGNPNSGAQHTQPSFFVNTVFQQVPNGQARVGDSGRGIVTGPRFQRWDFALFKNTKIYGESMSLQFRAEAINLFNHTNWNGIGTSFTTASTFGQVTSANDARIMQLGLKLNF